MRSGKNLKVFILSFLGLSAVICWIVRLYIYPKNGYNVVLEICCTATTGLFLMRLLEYIGYQRGKMTSRTEAIHDWLYRVGPILSVIPWTIPKGMDVDVRWGTFLVLAPLGALSMVISFFFQGIINKQHDSAIQQKTDKNDNHA